MKNMAYMTIEGSNRVFLITNPTAHKRHPLIRIVDNGNTIENPYGEIVGHAVFHSPLHNYTPHTERGLNPNDPRDPN